MDDSIKDRLRQIQMEDYIWILYLFIIGFSFYANSLERNYFLTKNIESKEKYRKINIFIFLTLIFVYAYFEKEALFSFQIQNKRPKQQKLDILSLIGTTAVLVSGFIFLYVLLEDNDLEQEIAFN